MWRALKAAAIYTGTIIGAGFASGREISLYFDGNNIAVPIFAAILCGFFCYVFLYLGRVSGEADFFNLISPKIRKVFSVSFYFSALIILSAMMSGADLILNARWGLAGIIGVAACIVIIMMGKNNFKIINLLLVPVIIILIFLIFNRYQHKSSGSGMNILNAVSYASMNIYMGGYIVYGDGRKMKKGEIWFCAVLCTAVFAALLSMIHLSVNGNTHAMPILDVSEQIGLSLAARVVICVAIFTTMLSSVKVLHDRMRTRYDKATTFLFILSMPFLLGLLGFERIVRTFYPFIGLIGVAFAAVSTVIFIASATKYCANES